MASVEDQPLDEIVWRSPPIAQQMGGIQTNTVQPYFSRSPFFDGTSNNATLSNQAMYNPNMFYLVQTREAFEGHLRSMGGLEFMVTGDPSDGGRKQEHSGVWVVRKQIRRKRPGAEEDELTPLSSYFIVGDSIYMAPTLSTVTALTKLLSTASKLPLFTPSLGHTYFTPAPKPISAASTTNSTVNASLTNTQQATQASKESTPAPGASQSFGKATDKQPSTNTATSSFAPANAVNFSTNPRAGANMLAESLSLVHRYGSEYMDETPLVGEPGAFIIQKLREPPSAPAAPKATASATASNVAGAEAGIGSNGVGGRAGGASPPPPPPPLKTDMTMEEKRKARAAEGKTPSSASPLTPGGDRKRKKSRGGPGVSGNKVVL